MPSWWLRPGVSLTVKISCSLIAYLLFKWVEKHGSLIGFNLRSSPPSSMNIIYNSNWSLASSTRSSSLFSLECFTNFVNKLIVHMLIVFDWGWFKGRFYYEVLIAEIERCVQHLEDMFHHVELHFKSSVTRPWGAANAKQNNDCK